MEISRGEGTFCPWPLIDDNVKVRLSVIIMVWLVTLQVRIRCLINTLYFLNARYKY